MSVHMTVGIHMCDGEDIGMTIRKIEGVPAHIIDIGGPLMLTIYATLEQIEQIGHTLQAYAFDVRLGAPLDKYGYFPDQRPNDWLTATQPLIEEEEQDA